MENNKAIGEFWSDVLMFLREAKDHWRQIVGGSVLFLILGVAASVGLNVPPAISIIAVFCLAFSWACFLSWRDQRETAFNLFERIKPKIQISGGESVGKSCIVSNGNFFFRARLESLGLEHIRNIEAHLAAIRKNGGAVELDEVVQLMMHPNCPTLPSLRQGVPGFADVVRTEFAKPVLATARPYAMETALSAGDKYELDVAISGEGIPTETRTFIFIWKTAYPCGYEFEMLNNATSSSRLQT